MSLEREIDALWEQPNADHLEPVEEVVARLDRGELRVAEKRGDEWVVHEWVKKAILLYFKLRRMEPQELGPFTYHDKIPLKRDHAERGVRVVVTGSRDEKELTAGVAGVDAVDLGGRTTFAELAGVLAGAEAVIVANTGPAHLAAAVGTPVVSLFAPTVPTARWAPYGVPAVVLGDHAAPCRGTRATTCPVPCHPCLSSVTAADVLAALDRLRAGP